MILPHAKPFNEKMRNNLLKKKMGKKACEPFSTLAINDIKTKKNYKSAC